jgi:hypothetical protein
MAFGPSYWRPAGDTLDQFAGDKRVFNRAVAKGEAAALGLSVGRRHGDVPGGFDQDGDVGHGVPMRG